jgi:hypothetical protein
MQAQRLLEIIEGNLEVIAGKGQRILSSTEPLIEGTHVQIKCF